MVSKSLPSVRENSESLNPIKLSRGVLSKRFKIWHSGMAMGMPQSIFLVFPRVKSSRRGHRVVYSVGRSRKGHCVVTQKFHESKINC